MATWDTWRGWRTRMKQWKDDHDIADVDISAALDRKRGTVNSWLNKREPNLEDFMEMCAAAGADPGAILFELPVIVDGSSAQRPGPTLPSNQKIRSFKQKKRKLGTRSV